KDGRKASLGNDGALAERNTNNWKSEIKEIILDKIKNELGCFKISETEFPPHFFTVNFPTRIHADTGRDENAQIYKQIMIPLEITPQGNESHTILFKNRWYGPASFFVGKKSASEGTNNQGHIKDVNNNFCYISDLKEFLKIIEKNQEKLIVFNDVKFFCHARLINDVNLLLKKERYNLVTSSHINHGKPFDRTLYEKYLTHHDYEDLYDLEIELIYKWNIGDMLIWDRTMLHSSDDYENSGGSQKKGIAIFTCK
ncbi:hypothetical protein OA856_01030, partial [Pelagibacteraceae bacterium]|nr:hypothetical protein [Pelagibacteraceae bacterium]